MDAHAGGFKTVVSSSLILSLLVLAGCDKPGESPPQTGAVAATPVQPSPPAPYTPPTAEQLSQMVAPIALFPDRLVAQVLAGATYPQQIAAANQWLGQYPSLKGASLQTAEAGQPWDVSVKALTAFPTVLGQMASNIQWTTALGEAYVNDPADVMNAIQLLRSRAQQSGNLKTSSHLRVTTVPGSTQRGYQPDYQPDSQSDYQPAHGFPDDARLNSAPASYAGPAVIAPPSQTIVIEPAAPDVVYVPQYNPTVVYGAPMPVYPGWVEPRPAYATETLVTTGALSFGIGVLVGAAVSHQHDGGWNAWGVNWGGPAPYRGDGGGWHRPAVVYNNAPYVSKSVTIVNHVNNINVTNNNYRTIDSYRTTNNNRTTNNINTVNTVNNVVNRTQNFATNNGAPGPAATMTMPHFTQRDTVRGARPLPSMTAQPAQPLHLAGLPPMNQFAASPHNPPTPPLVAHDFHQSQSQPQRVHQVQQPAHAQYDPRQPQRMQQAQHDSQRVQQVQQVQQAQQSQHDSQQVQQSQHDQHQPQQAAHVLTAATMTPPQPMRLAHDQRSLDRAPATVPVPVPAAAQMERQHADAMAQRLAQERSSAPVHLSPVPQLSPAPHLPPAMPPAPSAHREASPSHGQPQVNHQEMLALHTAPPRPAEQRPAPHVEQHAQSAQHHENHESHDKHDPHEKHG